MRTLNILSIVALGLGIVFLVLPMGQIAFLPIGLALVLAVASLLLGKKGSKKTAKILTGAALALVVVALVKVLCIPNEVAPDTQFEEVKQQAAQESQQELEELE
jgi:hypothetical protein